MRIIFGHQRFGVQPFGGVSRYFVELARSLSQTKSVNASVFAPLHVNHYLSDPGLLKPWGLRVPSFAGSGLPLGVVNLLLSKLMVQTRRDVDVYHETYYTRFNSRPRGAVRLLTVFDMIHELQPDIFGRLDKTREVKASSIARADHLICISENTRRDLIEILNVPREKTSVVHLASSLKLGNEQNRSAAHGRPYLLYVGGRGGYKNFTSLLIAYASSRRLRREFRILCFGGGSITAAESDQCRQLGLVGDDVQMISGSDEALARAYCHAAMLVYTSSYEGFGLPPLEAMSLDCPVICSNSSSMPEVVGEAGHYFDCSSIEDLRRSIEHVADDSTHAQRLVRLGKLRAETFSWNRCAAETLSIYETLIGGPRHAPSLHK